jgi:hypothetical protein
MVLSASGTIATSSGAYQTASSSLQNTGVAIALITGGTPPPYEVPPGSGLPGAGTTVTPVTPVYVHSDVSLQPVSLVPGAIDSGGKVFIDGANARIVIRD